MSQISELYSVCVHADVELMSDSSTAHRRSLLHFEPSELLTGPRLQPDTAELHLHLWERQRLETILNLCAEYNKGETSGLDPLVSGRTGFPGGGSVDGSCRRPSPENVPGGTTMVSSSSAAALRLLQRQRESDEENLKEECSSTESTHQEVRTPPALGTPPPAAHNGDGQHEDSSGSGGAGRLELNYLEDERVRVLARLDELKGRLTELEQQLQESRQEAEMERALLQGERQAELDQIEAETDIITQLQHKLDELESAIQREKEQERCNVEAERRALQSLQEGYAELENQLHNCPESLREQLQEQLKRDGEALETGTKKFEDLEFQQLERESSLEEERETISQQLLQERAEYHGSVATRKEKVSALENQAGQLGLQASQECERLAKDRTLALQMLLKEKERLSALEKRYHGLTGGRSFPKSSTAMREDYVTVGQLNHMYGMPKVESSPTSPLRQPLQSGPVDPAFSPHGSSLALSLEYQSEGSRPHIPKLDLEQWYQDLMSDQVQLCPPSLPAKSGRRPVLQVEGSSSSSSSFPLILLLFVCVGTFIWSLSSHTDKHESKLKGVIYFQAIEEVYYDHLRSATKSPNPSLTFCVKTHDRLYYMVAPAADAMRIWMDVIVTGAEGYTQFMN
ncbi:pleckstrin homology-like domain family B member 1 [Anarrhichthys ocellatus]|uniref:pleckstrin homology-like domain family B member 1 n=1 Tax=Anarrhichthys ocellatus TaxID=433405 RepID=UPI0012ED8497|nr:pleckstrin homology-like domain family B member 1 [Anarrhichthys ocellatus]